MRPHTVGFGKLPLEQDRIDAALGALFIFIGTSRCVYPAAGFVYEVGTRGRAHTVELNLEPSHGESHFVEHHCGQASQIVPQYVERLLTGETDFGPS